MFYLAQLELFDLDKTKQQFSSCQYECKLIMYKSPLLLAKNFDSWSSQASFDSYFSPAKLSSKDGNRL